MIPQHRRLSLGYIVFAVALLLASLPSTSVRVSGSGDPGSDGPTPTEKELLVEINLMRSDPAKYAMYLEQSKKYYKGKDYKPPGHTQYLTTVEGVSAVDEAIKVLRSTKPLPAYVLSTGMCMAARDHIKDLGRTGNSGHRGTDGSTVESRVNRYGLFSNGIGENIFYQNADAREVVMAWLVDDGTASRGHRRNLLSTGYRYLGVGVGDRSDFGSMCVLTFAGEFVETKGTTPAKGKPTAVRKM